MPTAFSAVPEGNYGLSLQLQQTFSGFLPPGMPTEHLASVKIDALQKPSCFVTLISKKMLIVSHSK